MFWLVIAIAFLIIVSQFDLSFPEGSWKWCIGFAIAAMIGVGFLYQQGGGKIFGPGGLLAPLATQEPLTLYGFKIEKYETGIFSNTLTLKNETNSPLQDIEVVLTLYRDDGTQVPVKKFWAKWSMNEFQQIEFPSAAYQKMVLSGVAMDNEKKVKLDTAWTFNKK